MPINRAAISKELLPGLNAVFGMEYGEVNNEHEPLYEVENSDRSFEEEVLFTGFGTAPTKNEGAAVVYDDAGESYTSRYTNETIALAFAITEEAMEDNLYDTFAKLRAKGLARAMANTKQVKAAKLYNEGFTTAQAIVDSGCRDEKSVKNTDLKMAASVLKDLGFEQTNQGYDKATGSKTHRKWYRIDQEPQQIEMS